MPLFSRKKQEQSSKPDKTKSQFYAEINLNNDGKGIIKTDEPSSESSSYNERKTHNRSPNYLNSGLALDPQGDLGQPKIESKWSKKKSSLSCTFSDCLQNKDILPYFIQYMTMKDKAHLVKFRLDAQNFYEASQNLIRTNAIFSSASSKLTHRDNTEDDISLDDNNIRRDDPQDKIKSDAVSIYSRYVAKDSEYNIGLTEELRNSTISKICSESGVVDPLCFIDCQTFVEQILLKDYYKEFLESPFFRKYQIQILTNGRLELMDILYNDGAMFYFTEFIQQENASSLLQFWMAADNFQTQLEQNSSGYTAKDAKADSMILYEKYFSLQASEPLGFNDKIRNHIELNICREEGPLPDCFLIPKIIILETMEKTLFHPFLSSQIYIRFLSELVGSSSLTGTAKSKLKTHKRSDSNSSYDTRSLEHNNQDGKISASSSSSDIRPGRLGADGEDQPLWRRVHYGKSMSLGRLNNFGQYTSEFDLENVPDLNKNKGNRFSRKKREKEKAQEDMAWEIAKMIINDINKEISQGNNNNSVSSDGTEQNHHQSSEQTKL